MSVKIPRDIASHIEGLRAEGRTNREIMEEALRSSSLFGDYLDLNFDTFAEALSVGFTVKKSPEEEILWYYKQAESDAFDGDPEYEEDKKLADIASAKMDAVEFVLAELNVKISGVNVG